MQKRSSFSIFATHAQRSRTVYLFFAWQREPHLDEPQRPRQLTLSSVLQKGGVQHRRGYPCVMSRAQLRLPYFVAHVEGPRSRVDLCLVHLLLALDRWAAAAATAIAPPAVNVCMR